MRRFLPSLLATLLLALAGGVVAGCGDDGVPKDNSNVKGPPPPPPPGSPSSK